MFSKKELYVFFGWSAALLLLLSQWHSINTWYPRYDEGDYTAAAQRIYYGLIDGGFSLQSLKEIYEQRVYKGNIVPQLMFPFLLLTKGHVLQANASFCLFFYALFIFTAFLIGRLISKTWHSHLIGFFLSSIPWVYTSGHGLNSEMPYIALALATLYFFLCFFQSKKHRSLFFIFYSLTFCVRPVESFIYLVPGLGILFLSPSYRKKILTHKHQILAGTALSFIFIGTWFSPTIKETLKWIIESTFTGMAKDNSPRQSNDVLAYLWGFFKCFLGINTLVLLLMIPFSKKEKSKLLSYFNQCKTLIGAYLIGLSCLIIGGTLSFSGDLRYYYIGFIILFIISFFLTYRTTPALSKYKTAVLCLLCLGQFIYNALMTYDPWQQNLTRDHFFGIPSKMTVWYGWWPRWTISPPYPYFGTDPMVQIFMEIKDSFPEGQAPSVLIFRIHKQESDWHWGINEGPYSVLLNQYRFKPSPLKGWVYSTDLEENYRRLKTDFELAVIGPVSGVNTSGYLHPSDLGVFMLKNYIPGSLKWGNPRVAKDGFKIIKEIKVSNFDGKETSFLFFTVPRK